MIRATADLSPDGKRVEVFFPYSATAVSAIKGVPRATFVGRDTNPRGPFWTVPLEFTTIQSLKTEMGFGLEYGPKLKQWGIQEKRRRRQMRSLALADDAKLEVVPKILPRVDSIINGERIKGLPYWVPKKSPLRRPRDARPYQRADIAMMSKASVLNGNQPGTGKTIEYIGATAEAGLINDPHLILAPVTSHFDTWVRELQVCNVPGVIHYGDTPAERLDALRAAAYRVSHGVKGPTWVILGFDAVRLKKLNEKEAKEVKRKDVFRRDHKGNAYVLPGELQQIVFGIEWATVCIDESHKTGLPNPTSLFALGAAKLRMVDGGRRFSMSGTPMGGKPIRLWGHLHWLDPKTYSSSWAWAEQWLSIDDNGFGKKIGGIKPGLEDDFYRAHAHHMVRREKKDALPGLPEKVIVDVICEMTPKQKKQYEKFERDAEIRIGKQRLSATNILAEYTRLKSFANAACTLREARSGRIEVVPGEDSGKLVAFMEKLDTHGIRRDDPVPGARAIAGSESVEMVRMIAGYLRKKGIAAVELHGKVKPDEKKAALARFRSDAKEPIVLCMTIATGGVSLNLEMADSVHALDESWDPDDMEQFEDRADRGSRSTPLVVYYYRTKGTIQEYIQEVASEKAVTNKNVMDIRRKMLKVKESQHG